ncbi:glycosyltransferase family 39 protein [Mycolicibacterium sp. J2]|uniref:glycosyltransferase family 39 protein n=1 Tax=Mycolicibacterium sp. J2 TaxID=2993511 RepID=UPI00224B21B7|nr:glycosyltransferase family 39 protein [Mycolicibacterium sp. J2]MCX2715014.1 glycosyltransferase family 39 protein [Mycolicibacterium sp. J2]
MAVRERVGLVVLLAGTAVLYLWNLSVSGWANSFYSAAVQAGASDWTAMLFGSSDAANAITVDKTPAALWLMDISVRLFGLHPWSVLLPQALEGIAAVGVVYAAVRRVSGPAAALLAGAVLALTPAAALIFRFNNPDALLVLLLVIGAYGVQRACEPGSSRWWMVAVGVAVGFGFLAKMLQAFLVLPAFAAAYLICAAVPLRTRLLRLGAATLAMVTAGGWYLLLVELWPAASRPYIGGSQHNSIVELALGYNGLGRLTGDEVGGLGNMNHDVGWGRLLGFQMGTHIAWLLPAALIGLVAGVVLTRHAPRTDATRAALILWGGWLVVTAGVFSYANGILHPYYTVALAPAIGACLAIGANLLWRNRSDVRCATALAGMVAVTVVLAAVLLGRQAEWMPWLRAAVPIVGIGAAVLLLAAGRLPRAVTVVAATLAIAASLAGPGAYAVATAASPHSGAIPSVGPGRGFSGGPFDAPTPKPALTALLSANAADYTWVAATVGSTNAAGYQLATGAPVLAVGGFNGTDPAPTLSGFQDMVAQKKIHYFIHAALMGNWRGQNSGSREAADIASWVQSHFAAVPVAGVTVYDLTRPLDS